jgi:AcrR family transcriptional regulator
VPTATDSGRTNQKQRTRAAIVDAARNMIQASGEVTMPAVSETARVSEATAYRYFPDLVSLISEAFTELWEKPIDAMQPVADLDDPVERVAHAATVLLSEVASYQGAVRIMMSAAIIRPDGPAIRPMRRLALIELALAPVAETLGKTERRALHQLRNDLAVVISAEAFFTLTDLCGLSAKAAISSGTRTARTLTAEAMRAIEPLIGR